MTYFGTLDAQNENLPKKQAQNSKQNVDANGVDDKRALDGLCIRDPCSRAHKNTEKIPIDLRLEPCSRFEDVRNNNDKRIYLLFIRELSTRCAGSRRTEAALLRESETM